MGLVDETLFKQYGNPPLYDPYCDDKDDAILNGKMFAASEGFPVKEVRVWSARENSTYEVV